MAGVGGRRSASTESEDTRSETLDPRICVELEKLNKASENINNLELELDEARLLFRHVLSESTHQLNDLSKKLGSCIDKSRPYYEARVKLAEAQRNVQNAALRFERACSQLTAAKEMVNLAEQGYFTHGQPFDPAWQEMLNHGTMKVNDAEQERLESEVEHRVAAQILNDAEQLVKKLQREWKRNIAKSRPYFELKAKVNQQMEDQKKKVSELEAKVAKAKASYAQTLRNLEKISDEIHHRRRRRERRRAKASASAEKKGPVIYHPLMNSSPEEDSGNDQTTSGDEGAHSLSVDSVTDATPSSSSIAQTSDVQCDSNKENWCKPRNSVLESSDSKPLNSQLPNADRSRLVPNGNGKNERNVQSVKSPAKVPCSTSTNESLILSPDADTEQIRMNAAVMAAISRSKQQRVISSPFLRPNSSRDDFLVDGSETDSVSGSFVSGSVCNLDDDQIESLMRDTDEYRRIVATMDATESDHFSRLSLPARLRHLRDYFNFEPTWDDDDDDDGDDVEISVAASDDRDLDTSGWDTSGIGSHNGGSTSSAYSAECSSSSASACAASVQSNAAEKDLNYACKAPVRVECSARHPLANVTEGSDSG